MNKELYQEVIFLTGDIDHQSTTSYRDSLHYMKGWSYYATRNLQNSAAELSLVGPGSTFFHKAHFFAAYNYTHLGNYDHAIKKLQQIDLQDKNLSTLRNFELAGIYLLKRDYKQYDKHFQNSDTTYYPIAEEAAKLNVYASELRTHKPKSPFLACIMSSVIPGSGKIYAGETGEGISSLLTVGGLGFVTWENYRKKGPTHIKTLFFGAVFSAFYIGNIYGTYFSVKISEEELQHEYDNKILFNLHIPLRVVFN
jgi:tetratricopeptide (TPR) repeat protein